MIDLRPVGYVIGLLVASLGVTMLVPMGVDLYYANGHAWDFVEAMIFTVLVGGFMAQACANGVGDRLTIQQTFLLASGVWLCLPLFGAIPFMTGATEANFTNAFFEAMSGLTTTGSTVFTGLEYLPQGLLLWRSMLQWFGGIGIIVVAMVFLPELRIGGMQIFRSEAFDTMGKALPRAAEIARNISVIYVGLTGACTLSYVAAGMPFFDAVNHALTTMSTGGFSTWDASMGKYQGAPEYVASVFMVLASLPFVLYIQMVNGRPNALFSDAQVKGFVWVMSVTCAAIVLFRLGSSSESFEPILREAIFNITSIATGTGYASVDYQLWGAFPIVIFFFIGLVGGCAGSTCCSVKIFRYQILMSSIRVQIQRIHSPNGVFTPRYDGKPVAEDVLSSVIAFFMLFIVTLGVVAVLLAMTGLDFVTSVSGAATALANIGPGLGNTIGPAGNFATLNDPAKWILTAAMFVGRLELMVVYAILTVTFWRS
jgi:trk system potassium uptake protein TrkH